MTRRLLALAFTAFVALTLWAQEAQKREMRTVWIATVSNIDWPQTRGTGTATINKQKKQLTDLLDGFVKANMNSVCLQVRPMADALYKSSYEPWSSYLTGTRGQDPGWDPLAFAVEECHKRGLEINAWVNPYRFSNSSGNDCNTAIDQNLKNSGILMQVGNRIVFNPALKASRDHLLKVCKEMIQNYDIDGIIFDDYFYPGGGTPEDSSAPDYQLYTQSNSGMSIGDWRRANVNQMVKDMWDMVQATKPYVKFSIGPAGVAGQRSTSATKHGVVPVDEYCRASDWQYTTIYSDPLAWLEEGTIDYISPQLYWKTNHTTNPFGPLTNWWSYIAEHFGRHHYASHNIYFMEKTNTKADWDEILQQIRYSRQYNRQNAPGVNFYSAKYIDGPTCKGFADYLSQTLFTHKALEPAMPWHSKTNYDAPANLAYSGGTLSWTGVNKKLVRYSVYAVPLTVTLDEAQSQAFDGIKSDYLVGVTYTPSFKLDASLQSGYWYAVCVVDGWNNEFAPAFYNLATEYADKVTLVSPIAGTAASWNQQFAWTAADDATYELQISDDATFGNVLIQRKQITSNSATADLSGKTLYATGEGAAPEYALRYLLKENGLDGENAPKIQWCADTTEALSYISSDENAIAMLPQPFVTAAQAKVDGLRVALSLNDEWAKLDNGSAMVTGVVVCRSEFAEKYPQQLEKFMQEYDSSVKYVQENTEDAAALIGNYEIVKAPIAKKALPYCNITFITGTEMKTDMESYLSVLNDMNPKAIGGKLPGADFYYGA